MRTRWTIFAETFVLLLYRGRNLRGFLRVVTDCADLLPIEIFRGCGQEAKLRRGLPRRTSSLRTVLGQPLRVQKIQRILNILFEGIFRSSAVAQRPRHGTCRRAGLRRAACAAGTVTDVGPRTMKAMRDSAM